MLRVTYIEVEKLHVLFKLVLYQFYLANQNQFLSTFSAFLKKTNKLNAYKVAKKVDVKFDKTYYGSRVEQT